MQQKPSIKKKWNHTFTSSCTWVAEVYVLLHRLSLSQELKKAPMLPAQQPLPPVASAPPQPQVNSYQCNTPHQQESVDFEKTDICYTHIWACIWPVTINWHQLIFVPDRCSEEEKQMGLCNPSDPGPAHHHHDYCNAPCCCVCDNHCNWHQDNGHLCSGHHPEEGQAVKRLESDGA